MTGCRKIIGLLIIIFIGVPVLIGVIWGVGFTRAVVSPEFLSDIPQEIIAKIPDLMDETLEAVNEEGVISDHNAREWVRAVADADTSPKELLEKIGIIDWLDNELSQSLDKVGKILRGEMKPRPIMLNLRPLKTALAHEGINRYLAEIIKKLPTCTDTQVKDWVDILVNERYDETPPACKPLDMEADKAVMVLRQAWLHEVDEIPDQVDIFRIERGDFFPYSGIDISGFVMSLTYFLFIVPALFIGLGALIGASSGTGILRWIGVSTLVGGILSYGLSKLTGGAVQWGMDVGSVGYSYTDVPFSEVGRVFVEKTGDIALVIIHHLFSAVNTVAGIVCIVGIVLIALSYAVVREKAPQPGQKPVEPQKPAPQPVDTAEDKDRGKTPEKQEPEAAKETED